MENQPVTLFAEPPLHADIIMSNSMMESLIRGLPDWTTKTSFSRTLVNILTLVSPLHFNMVSMKTSTKAASTKTLMRNTGGKQCVEQDGSNGEAHIGELRQLGVCGRHAQVLTDLACESWARVPGENKRVAHRRRDLQLSRCLGAWVREEEGEDGKGGVNGFVRRRRRKRH